MDVEPSIAYLGALIAAPARANILAALFDGRALTATELSYAAGISAQTTSSHLAKLLDARLLVAEQHGRFRYFRLAGPEVAEALEPLTHISPHKPIPSRGRSKEVERLRKARFCYDHIAGHLGVLIASSMLSRKYLVLRGRNCELTKEGMKFFGKLGLDVDKIRKQRRVFALQCLDWSERKPHLAGALGAAIATEFVDRQWVKRDKKSRAVDITELGRKELNRSLGVSI